MTPNNKKSKKKKTDSKEAPKKKVGKAKTKIDSKAIAKRKKAPGIEKLKEMEQAKFEELEKKFLWLIQRWEQVIDTQDTPKLNMILSELLTKVEEFSAPFVKAYNIPKMIKKTKLVEGHNIETRKQLWGKMKELYEKKKESVPAGFLARKRSDAPKAKKAITSVERKNERGIPEAPPEDNEATGAGEWVKETNYQESIPFPPTSSLNSPIKRHGSLNQCISSERQAEPKPEKSVRKPERKKKFDLLGLLGIARPKPSIQTEIISESTRKPAARPRLKVASLQPSAQSHVPSIAQASKFDRSAPVRPLEIASSPQSAQPHVPPIAQDSESDRRPAVKPLEIASSQQGAQQHVPPIAQDSDFDRNPPVRPREVASSQQSIQQYVSRFDEDSESDRKPAVRPLEFASLQQRIQPHVPPITQDSESDRNPPVGPREVASSQQGAQQHVPPIAQDSESDRNPPARF